MSAIVSLRGTSGSGKSWVVHKALRTWHHEVLEWTRGKRKDRPLVYRIELPASQLYVFGSYETKCGGCDTITDYKTIVPVLLKRYAPKGHVLFEGLLMSGGYGRVGAALSELQAQGHNVVCAILDTPLDKCLRRVNTRRMARGVEEPVNPKNTEQKHRQILNSIPNLENQGLRCTTINHNRSFSEVMKLFGVRA